MEPRAGLEPAACSPAYKRGLRLTKPSFSNEKYSVTKSHDERIENWENLRIIEEFKDFLKIDRGLKEATIEEHLRYIKMFFRFVKKPFYEVTIKDIRGFLKQKYNSHSVKAVRVFFGSFLGKKEMVQTFKVPQSPFVPKIVPSKEKLRKFYNEIKSLKEKAIFLLLASSGLRLHEVMELKFEDIDLEKRMIKPATNKSRTKRVWVSFFNDEAAEVLKEYMKTKKPGEYLFSNAKKPGKIKPFRFLRKKYRKNWKR